MRVRRKKRNRDRRPIISPCLTKIVSSSFKGSEALRYAGFHHSVHEVISPFWLIKADIPVFALLAIALRVSIALKLAYERC